MKTIVINTPTYPHIYPTCTSSLPCVYLLSGPNARPPHIARYVLQCFQFYCSILAGVPQECALSPRVPYRTLSSSLGGVLQTGCLLDSGGYYQSKGMGCSAARVSPSKVIAPPRSPFISRGEAAECLIAKGLESEAYTQRASVQQPTPKAIYCSFLHKSPDYLNALPALNETLFSS